MSDTWFTEHVSPTVFREPSGAACNGYRLWREDLALAAGRRLTAYRFSVEWARVEPVAGEFSESALDHHEAVVSGCLELGLAPVRSASAATTLGTGTQGSRSSARAALPGDW